MKYFIFKKRISLEKKISLKITAKKKKKKITAVKTSRKLNENSRSKFIYLFSAYSESDLKRTTKLGVTQQGFFVCLSKEIKGKKEKSWSGKPDVSMVRFRHPGQAEGLLGGGEAQLWQVGMEGHADTAILHLPKVEMTPWAGVTQPPRGCC